MNHQQYTTTTTDREHWHVIQKWSNLWKEHETVVRQYIIPSSGSSVMPWNVKDLCFYLLVYHIALLIRAALGNGVCKVNKVILLTALGNVNRCLEELQVDGKEQLNQLEANKNLNEILCKGQEIITLKLRLQLISDSYRNLQERSPSILPHHFHFKLLSLAVSASSLQLQEVSHLIYDLHQDIQDGHYPLYGYVQSIAFLSAASEHPVL